MRNPAEAGWRRLGVVLSFLAVAVLAAMPFIAVAGETPSWWAERRAHPRRGQPGIPPRRQAGIFIRKTRPPEKTHRAG